MYEQVEDGSSIEGRSHVSEAVEIVQKTSRPVRYRHLDRLGSLEAATTEAGAEDTAYEHGYDAFAPSRPRLMYDDFVARMLGNAIQLEQNGDHNAALIPLGMGMHAIMDSHSAAHADFAVWRGFSWSHPLNWLSDLQHVILDAWSEHTTRVDDAAKDLRVYYDQFLTRSAAGK